MASVRVSWTPTPTSFPEGTPALTHYVAHLGAIVSADLAPGLSTHTFADVAPGDYPSAVDSMAGTVTLATHAGNVVHVPQPVLIPVAMGVNAAVVP